MLTRPKPAENSQLYILTQSPEFADILHWLDQHGCWYEVHLNRTRFYVEPGRLYTEFMLRYSQNVGSVTPETSLLASEV
jgi:hypothetical protein